MKKKGGWKLGRGKQSFYYSITESGLELLIKENPNDSLKFWKILIGYCHHNNEYTDDIKIQKFIDLFKKTYMKFKYSGYSDQLDIFDNMIEKWLQDFTENMSEISNEQKIFEILAVKRGLTFKQLVDETKSSESEIIKILSLFTLQNYEPLKDNLIYISPGIVIPFPSDIAVDTPPGRFDKNKEKYGDFLRHCLITSSEYKDKIDGETLYELSIYGIMLVLMLIRRQDMGKLEHGLFYTDTLFPEYFDKVVNTYQDKLPLIFGKWDILKDVLRLFSAYNFDIVVDKDIRQRKSELISIASGGNKQLLEGIKEIVLQNRNQLFYFYYAGETIFNNYMFDMKYGLDNDKVENKKSNDYLEKNDISKNTPYVFELDIIRKILNDILITLYPIECAFNEFSVIKYPIDNLSMIRYLAENTVKMQEKMFEWEITSLYYSNLYFDFESATRFGHPMIYYSILENKENVNPIHPIPKDCLKSILELDKQGPRLGEIFSDLIEDVHLLSTEVERNLAAFTRN